MKRVCLTVVTLLVPTALAAQASADSVARPISLVEAVFIAPGMMEREGQFVLGIVARHETFFDFPRLYKWGEYKLNVAAKPNDDNCAKTTAPRGRSAKPFAGTDR